MSWLIPGLVVVGGIAVVLGLATSIKIIPQRFRGVVEFLGKYQKVKSPGLTLIAPFGIGKLRWVDITEQIADVAIPDVITKDQLNLKVAVQIYYKVKDDTTSLQNSQYKVFNYQNQIIQLASSTTRKIIGGKTLGEANIDRMNINEELKTEIGEQIQGWGLDLVRVEVRELTPPQDVQNSMNNVIMSMQAKDASVNNANAKEIEADGLRRAEIKKAQGEQQAAILKAQGEAKAIKIVADASAKKIQVVNQAIQKYFKGDAQLYKKMEMVVESLKDNTKVITQEGSNLVNVLSEAGGITPIDTADKSKK